MKPRRLQRPTISSMSASLDAGAVIRPRTMGFGVSGSSASLAPSESFNPALESQRVQVRGLVRRGGRRPAESRKLNCQRARIPYRRDHS